MEETITRMFIDVLWEMSKKEIPREITEECKISLLDYIACANLGSRIQRNEREKALEASGYCEGASTVIGSGIRRNAPAAALWNGISAHAAELDDGHRYAMLHPGVPVISAVLAAAQDRGLSAGDCLRGIVTGYEAVIRLASAIQPGHKKRGYHATGTCGTIGAAAGVMAALDTPRELWNTGISAAVSSASGLLQLMDDVSELKPFNAGRAASAAVEAAYFAACGLKGPADPLGGKRGFFAVMADLLDREALLGRRDGYAIKGIYRKPYASCRHSHAAVEAVLNICREHQTDFRDIRSITVRTYDLAVRGHDHTDIMGAGSARMSIPYAVAAAVKYGRVNFQEYSQTCLGDRELGELMKKVLVQADDSLSKLVPEKRAAVVKVTAGDQEYECRVDYPLGEPENPISRLQMEEKYRSMMEAAGRTKRESEKLLDAVYHIETRFEELLDIL